MVDEVITKQELIDAQKDAQALDDFINGGDEQIVITRLLKEYPTLANAIRQIYEKGGKFYPTLADANADIANLVVNQVVSIGEADNGGLWYKATAGATSLTKSAYDPLTQARNYADSNPLFKPVMIADVDLNTILESGIYTAPSQESATLALNFPTNEPGFLLVARGMYSSVVFQTYYARNTIFTRYYNSVVWSAWSDNGYTDIVKNSREILENRNIIETAFDMSSNIFSGAIPNTTIDSEGNIVADSSRWLGDFVSCAKGEIFSVTPRAYRINYYDENKVFISRISLADLTTFTVPYSNYKYFRLSGTTPLETMQLNKGETLLPYEPFKLQPKYLPKLTVPPEQTTFFEFSENIFDQSTAVANTSMDAAGNIVADAARRWLSDFIPVEFGKTYSVPNQSYRINYFNNAKQFLVQHSVALIDSFEVTRSNAEYVRLSSTLPILTMQMNEGETLLPFEPFGKSTIKEQYLPDGSSIDIDALRQQLIDELTPILAPKYEPSFPTLNFSDVYVSVDQPLWLSADGEVIYGKGKNTGRQLLQSTDDWATKVQIGATEFTHAITGIRTLDDGELLISTTRSKSPITYSKLWKTVGYDRNNPSAATFVQVLESTNLDAFFTNRWGMSVYQNIVTASEYGLWGTADGAKHVYLSTDYGNTFNLIFDLYVTDVPNRPTLTETAHMHTVAYDPYFNRIWVAVGDNPNTATYYSDDMGASWTYVTDSNLMQYTGIQALPDTVIFGSDRAPNGVFVYHRKDKYTMPEIEPLLKVNDLPVITHVFGLPFKKDWSPTSPVYFSAPTIQNTTLYAPCIVATVDGKKAFKMWEGDKGDVLEAVVGPTANNKIVLSLVDEVNGGYIIKRANAPTWSR